ncbi:MAG: SDR family NAD(P)-dependent oxidoreductase [Bacteroidetes bacterium]|nr:SDR family NAD(P)-dependent oxidoreductase [Bacteroidota bacterium]
MKKRWKHAIVVGASQGIGEALVMELARQGVSVALVSRNEDAMKRVAAAASVIATQGGAAARFHTYAHDVTNFAEVPELFQRITKDLGGLDLIVYGAGMMPYVAMDEYTFETDKAIVDVNLLGAMAWLNEAAKRFHSLEEGCIVGISSIAGERGRVGSPAYNVSKAALSTYLESLRNRLSRRGVSVTTIKPGVVDTAMSKNSPTKLWLTTADEVARQTLKAARRGVVVKYIPSRWRLISFILHSLPSFIFRRLTF